MPTNFLANLGTGMRGLSAAFSPEFSTGANLGAGLRNRFRKRPGEPEDDMDQPSSRPSFDSDATSKLPNVRPMMEDPVADAEDDARRNLPINPPGSDDPLGALITEETSAGRPALPNLPPRSRMPGAVTPPAPGGVNMPAPAFEPSTLRDYRGRDISSDPIGFERDIYMRGKMQPGGGFKRSAVMALRNAMLGAGEALSRGGGIESALGGAIAGAGGSLINPRAGHEFGFEYGERPRLEAEAAREQAKRDRANLEIVDRAKLDDLRATTDERRARTEAARRPPSRRGELKMGVDRVTGERRFYDPSIPEENARFEPFVADLAKPRPDPRPTAAELSVDPSGKSAEEIAIDSYNSRGGDQYVFDRLPARTKQILSAGKITNKDGTTSDARQDQRDAAQKEFERAVERQRKTDLDYTRGRVRSRRLGAGKAPAAPSGSQSTANLADLEKLWR